ncbi:MAG: hypothetical protein GPJ54_21290 [Candidatus Heimdallarchaeota archaeon]|nr:hypothetical protein [Candidatus Heimdallarchaeota archaeon]
MTTATDKLDELARTHNFPNDYISLLQRGFYFLECSKDRIFVKHKKELDILDKNKYFLLLGEYNLTDLNDKEYRFTDLVGFFNALDKYQYECIRRRDYTAINNYYIMRFDNPYRPNVTSQLRRIRNFIHQ